MELTVRLRPSHCTEIPPQIYGIFCGLGNNLCQHGFKPFRVPPVIHVFCKDDPSAE